MTTLKTQATALVLLMSVLVSVTHSAMAAESGRAQIQVVTTLPVYASIAQFVGGERVVARAISRGDEDAHFVKPKPSFALMLKQADLFVTTGLDLELWAPILVDKSGNRGIRDGEPGFVSASAGVTMRNVPASVSREGGDVHVYGNPHIHTSPINAKVIASNIVGGLKRVDPGGAARYDANLAAFVRRIDESLYGKELLDVIDSATLDALAQQGKLIDFLESNDYQGETLIDSLGGWLGTAQSFRGRKIVAYHDNWVYFTDLFGLEVVDFVERKPGIPPSARHVFELLGKIEEGDIKVVLAASYFSRGQIESIGERSGATPVIVALGPMEVNADGYFELVDGWIGDLERAFDS